MPLFCICQVPSRIFQEDGTFLQLQYPREPMKCVKTGVRMVIDSNDKHVHKHADVFQCSSCGATVVKD